MTNAAEQDQTTETSAAGRGLAEVGWKAAVDKLALRAAIPMEGPIRRMALRTVEDLVGFYFLWHVEGGFAGLERLGMPRATIYRKITLFKESFGEHPDTYRMPGMRIDAEEYLQVAGLPEGAQVPGMPRVLADARNAPAKLPR